MSRLSVASRRPWPSTVTREKVRGWEDEHLHRGPLHPYEPSSARHVSLHILEPRSASATTDSMERSCAGSLLRLAFLCHRIHAPETPIGHLIPLSLFVHYTLLAKLLPIGSLSRPLAQPAAEVLLREHVLAGYAFRTSALHLSP